MQNFARENTTSFNRCNVALENKIFIIHIQWTLDNWVSFNKMIFLRLLTVVSRGTTSLFRSFFFLEAWLLEFPALYLAIFWLNFWCDLKYFSIWQNIHTTIKFLLLPKLLFLKVQSCKLYNKKYKFASTQITSTEIFALIAILVFQLLNRKVLFTAYCN